MICEHEEDGNDPVVCNSSDTTFGEFHACWFSPTFEQVNNVELLHFVCTQPPSSFWWMTLFWGCCVNYRLYFHIFVCSCPHTERVKLDLGSVMEYKPRFSPEMFSVPCFSMPFSCTGERVWNWRWQPDFFLFCEKIFSPSSSTAPTRSMSPINRSVYWSSVQCSLL